jgi:uncharacterized protein
MRNEQQISARARSAILYSVFLLPPPASDITSARLISLPNPSPDYGTGIAALFDCNLTEDAMAEGSGHLHEPIELLSEETRNMHRAIVSVMEELEAIDWYQQRAEACSDPDLKKILLHNKEEEMEHAMMGLEWIRRHSPSFDRQARAYLFSSGDLTNLEKKEMDGAGESTGGGGSSTTPSQSLGIGSLRARTM